MDYDERYDRTQKQNGEFAYYEDTHDELDEYSQRLKSLRDFDDPAREESYNPSSDNIVSRQKKEEKQDNVRSLNTVFVYEPKEEKEAQNVIDFLKRGEPVILNLESASIPVAQRVLDFSAYALGASVRKISGAVFLVIPANVKVTSSGETK